MNSQAVIKAMHKALFYYNLDEIEGLGEMFAEMNRKLCGETIMYS